MSDDSLQSKIRSYCCEEGDCLVWHGGTDDGDVPQMRWEGRVQSVRRLLLAAKGVNIKGKYATTKCETPRCVADKHLKVLTRKQLSTRSAARTKYHERVSRNLAIAKARRDKGTVLSMEKVREMRARGLTSRQAAKEYGCGQSAACEALAGRSWADYADPFFQLRRTA